MSKTYETSVVFEPEVLPVDTMGEKIQLEVQKDFGPDGSVDVFIRAGDGSSNSLLISKSDCDLDAFLRTLGNLLIEAADEPNPFDKDGADNVQES